MGNPIRPPVGGARERGQPAPKPDRFALDLQTLLTHAVVRLRDTTRMTTSVAWALRPDATPYVAAAAFDGEPPRSPTRDDFSAVTTPQTVGALDSTPALEALSRRHGLSAAAVVRGADRAPMAVLLVGPATARPRVLAALSAAATRLSIPLAAALAAGRFRELDRDVQRLDQLAALGALTAEIAHEVRNPLVSIKTFLQLLPERGSDPEFAQGFLQLATDELRRMERLLDSVIEHAQPADGAARPEGAAIGEAAASALALVRHRADKRGVELVCGDFDALPRVRIGSDELRQVALNLLLNAIEATPAGGRVSVDAAREADELAIRISDDGPGIAPELREEIFTAFYSTRAGRTGGLGLAISRRIVSDAGGSIAAGDAERGGAEFCVRLPIQVPADPEDRS